MLGSPEMPRCSGLGIAYVEPKEYPCFYCGGTFKSKGHVSPGARPCCPKPECKAKQRERWQARNKKRNQLARAKAAGRTIACPLAPQRIGGGA